MLMPKVIELSTAALIELSHNGEALVCIGCDGETEWWSGMNSLMFDYKVSEDRYSFEEMYSYTLKEYGPNGQDLTCFIFPLTSFLNMGRLAMLRLEHGAWLKWLSDFVPNYITDTCWEEDEADEE